MAMNVEAEIRELKRRVSELGGSFGFRMRQVKGVHKDLLAFQARTEHRFDRIDGRLEKSDGRFERLQGGLRGLRADMPGIVGDAVRAGLRERSRKSSRKTP